MTYICLRGERVILDVFRAVAVDALGVGRVVAVDVDQRHRKARHCDEEYQQEAVSTNVRQASSIRILLRNALRVAHWCCGNLHVHVLTRRLHRTITREYTCEGQCLKLTQYSEQSKKPFCAS